MSDGDEPTWGGSIANPSGDTGGVGLNGVGGPSAPFPQGGAPSPGPHSEYHRQAAQHFQNGPVAPPPGQVSYPVVPPVVTPSVGVPPVTATPVGPQVPGAPLSYAVHAPIQGPANDTFVTRLVERGIRGELFRQPWFHQLRATQPDTFVFVSFGVGVVLSMLLSLIGSTFFATVLTDAVWVALAYLYFALGTKVAHQWLLWGVCVVGGVVTLVRIWSTFTLLSLDQSLARLMGRHVEPTGLLVLELLLDVAVGGLLIYVGIQLHREIGKLSRA
jgi:hypothetical protein